LSGSRARECPPRERHNRKLHLSHRPKLTYCIGFAHAEIFSHRPADTTRPTQYVARLIIICIGFLRWHRLNPPKMPTWTNEIYINCIDEVHTVDFMHRPSRYQYSPSTLEQLMPMTLCIGHGSCKKLCTSIIAYAICFYRWRQFYRIC
jgi:hypothetical protein